LVLTVATGVTTDDEGSTVAVVEVVLHFSSLAIVARKLAGQVTTDLDHARAIDDAVDVVAEAETDSDGTSQVQGFKTPGLLLGGQRLDNTLALLELDNLSPACVVLDNGFLFLCH
jgi:hypothetical protein